ncbi:hypothetical protein BBJ28_00020222, partial [Nothophytophthora sp. Chile5]
SEWGLLSGQFNPTKAFIDFCALIGQAYDLKRSRTASKTRERVVQEVRESRLKQGLSPAMSWWDRQMSQLFFGKSEAQIFHISSEVGMHLLGGKGLFLSSDDIQLGVNETLKDTALVLSRFNSIILARVYGHSDIEELGRLATVPVINALSDKYHPLQMLADYMTAKWDGALPRDMPHLTITHYQRANASMGQEEESQKRLQHFAGYQVTNKMLENAAKDHVFLHCLPRHQDEVHDEVPAVASFFCSPRSVQCILTSPTFVVLYGWQVFYGDRSLVFDEAENRLWTVMAVYACILLMGDKGGESKGGKNEVNPLKFIEQRVASAFPALVGPKFTAKYATEPNE